MYFHCTWWALESKTSQIADNRVMSWKVGQIHDRDAPHKSKYARANRNPFPKGQRMHVLFFVDSQLMKRCSLAERYDLHKVINESERELEQENAYAWHTTGREREQHSTLNMLGLSESEAVEYVLMLSREEAENRRVIDVIGQNLVRSKYNRGRENKTVCHGAR
ncbi:hypothetical protein EV702DRAFT_187766 [Suillus placidus]|uniref:Uncharacterized protein n=1 Tax=Suillus placidus TaxID=48579 RepID=A0A9P7D4D5_9AGAM|nr:hypothetical protein EV702DRAFT_187766 [Suillus placidus]